MKQKFLSATVGLLSYAVLAVVAGMLGQQGGGAGMLGGVVSSVAFVAAGFATVWAHAGLYGHETTGRRAAGFGAITGLVAAVLAYGATLLLILVGVMADPVVVIESQLAGMPPDQREIARSVVAFSNSPLGALLNSVVGTALGALGGLLGGRLTGRRRAEHSTAVS